MRHDTGRRIDGAAWAGLIPFVAVIPIFLLAMAPFWWLVTLVWPIGYWSATGLYALVGLLLFVPFVQRTVLTRLIGARRPLPDEARKNQRPPKSGSGHWPDTEDMWRDEEEERASSKS